MRFERRRKTNFFPFILKQLFQLKQPVKFKCNVEDKRKTKCTTPKVVLYLTQLEHYQTVTYESSGVANVK